MARLCDISSAYHSLRRHPGFTLLALLTIALGIGATTAVFSVAEAILLRPLPYHEPDRLVDVSQQTKGTRRLTVNPLDVVDLQRETEIFQDVAGRSMAASDLTLTGDGNQVFHTSMLLVTHNYFDVLGVDATLGRTFVWEDGQFASQADSAGAQPPSPAMVVTHGFWERVLGGDPDFRDRALRVGEIRLQVVGVLPPDFRLLHERLHRWVSGTGAEAFIVYDDVFFRRPRPRGGAGSRGILALGRLNPGITYEQAQAGMNLLAARLRAEHPAHENEELRVEIYPLHQDITSMSRTSVYVVAGGVIFLLLLVCANVANLQLVRARIRAGEDAVRAALGCGRGRLFGQKLWESLFLALGGGALGMGMAWGGIHVVQALAPQTVPLLDRLEMNEYALFFGLGVALISTILSGLLPALQAARLDPANALNRESRGTSARGRRRLMNYLVISELAFTMVLISGAAVMVRTLWGMSQADLGYDPQGVITFGLDVIGEEYRAALYRQLDGELGALPGVVAVARTTMVPLGEAVGNTNWGWSREILDQQIERAEVILSTPGYLQAMGTRLLAGRFFQEREAADSVVPVIVDAEAAQIAWPEDDPLGKHVFFWRSAQEGVVVGVVEKMMTRDFGISSFEALHVPETVFGVGAADSYVLRTPAVAGVPASSIRQAVQRVDPLLDPYKFRDLSDRVSLSMGPTRFVLFLMGAFGLIALAVAAIGLFGVIAFTVRARTAELGIRMALGAEKSKVLSMVLSQAGLLTLLGVAGGTVAALLLARFMTSVAYGVSPTEPVTLGIMALALGGISILACLAPARWACRVDPVQALRGE
jgi:predicted permease